MYATHESDNKKKMFGSSKVAPRILTNCETQSMYASHESVDKKKMFGSSKVANCETRPYYDDQAVDTVVIYALVSPLKNEKWYDEKLDFDTSVPEEYLNWTNTLKSLTTEFRQRYKEPLNKMSEDLLKQNGYPLILPSLVIGVGNDLFNQGITWSCIISFFAFTTELISVCLPREDVPKEVVRRIVRFVLFYVKRTLVSWIDDHGSWDGLVEFAKEREETRKSQKSIAMTIVSPIIRAFGIFAWAANATSRTQV